MGSCSTCWIVRSNTKVNTNKHARGKATTMFNSKDMRSVKLRLSRPPNSLSCVVNRDFPRREGSEENDDITDSLPARRDFVAPAKVSKA
mmetsp:Transcript_63811/g.143553  ORF Transcript_63811/g.143553 Transcript_63811/m.143553 type:complete len:89 (-) Transcript_63811:23-289(-)